LGRGLTFLRVPNFRLAGQVAGNGGRVVLVARLRRAGATGELIMRFDSGFWSNTTIATLERLDNPSSDVACPRAQSVIASVRDWCSSNHAR
jgi:hypothetical protein